jgi:hypothetical protein
MKKANHIFLILTIVFLHALASRQILKHSQIARTPDEKGRIIASLLDYRIIFLDHGTEVARKIDRLLTVDRGQSHPTLFEIVEAVSWRALDAIKIKDIDAMILLTSSFYLLILLFCVYGIGSRLYDPEAGLVAAFLTSMLPAVFGHTRIAMLDYPLMCMVTLTVYLLLKTDGLRSSFYSILTGIAFGLSELTKETAIVFILPPLAYYFVKSCLSGNKKRGIVNLTFILLFFVLVSGIIYFKPVNFHAFKTYLGKAYVLSHPGDPLYYLRNFVNYSGPFILAICLPLILSYLINIRKREKLPLFWFFTPLIFYSIFPSKTIRFFLPILPAFALIVTQELLNNNLLKRLKEAGIFILVSLSILQYAFINYGVMHIELKREDYLAQGILAVKNDKYLPVSQELLEVLKREAWRGRDSAKIFFLFDLAEIHSPVEIQVVFQQLPFEISCPFNRDPFDILKYGPVDWSEEILSVDYVVDKTGYLSDQEHAKYIADALRTGFAKYKNKFRMIAGIKVFDGSAVRIYKKTAN